MCFSATSSFVVASILMVTSAVALKNAPHKRLIPLALVPAGFAVQQVAEGLVWLTLDQPNTLMHKIGMYIFLTFAFIIWPLWMPFALKTYEQNPTKKMLLSLCQLLGLLFAIAAAFFLWAALTWVSSEEGNLAYHFNHSFFGQRSGLSWYLIPTILPFLILTNRIIGLTLGSLILISLAATHIITPSGLISVWCFLAAIISSTIIGIIWSEKHKKASA